MSAAPESRWIISRRTAFRGVWGLIGVVVFGVAAVAAIIGFVRAPHVDSAVLVLIVLPFFVMALVLAWEALSQGMVKVDGAGFSTPQGAHRAWGDVLAVGVGEVDGRSTPVVAVRSQGRFPIAQESFPGFADDEAERLVEEFRARGGDGVGFAGVRVSNQWWADAEAEADRVAGIVRAETGREPLSRERVPFGYPGVLSALRLDYGTNDAGERVEVFCRRTSDLALTHGGHRWLRQNRKRSADPATQVAWLFGPYEIVERPSTGAGFDRIALVAPDRKPLPFNAEEPDRFVGQEASV